MDRTARNRPTNRKPKATPRRRRCRPCLEPLEDRCLLSVSPTDFRPISEVGNNAANPTLGTANTDLLRLTPAAYAGGISSPSLPNNPSARVISDIVNNQADAAGNDIQTVDQNSLSDFGYAWGQFIDHDMDLTPTGSGEFDNILADPNDPSQMGTQTFERSTFDPSTGTSISNPRQQVNAVTSFLDLSNVYGSTDAVANALRTFQGGQLKTSDNGLELPLNNPTYFSPTAADPDPNQLAELNMANDSHLLPSSQLFAAGDVRANENVELTALQTLFVRNHNQIASELAQQDPTKFGFTSWTDENLYQEARKINIAEEQIITYTQYLPDILGPNALPAYKGYNANVNPAIATEFSTVGFRFGHSLLSNFIQRQDNNGNNIADQNLNGAPIDLAQDFFDPSVINPSGAFDPISGHTTSDIDAILKGDADGDAQAMDVQAINEVRNLLFANGGLKDNGQDLIARDIQRGRDDGIGSYNQVRVALGLPAVTSFAQITSNVTVQQELQKAYGNVDNIDAFEGGLAEDHVPGSDVGPTFQAILVNQFTRLSEGDRYFVANESWNPSELNILLQGVTLGQVIEANTDVTNLQPDVFKFTASIGGTVSLASNGNGGHPQGLAGVTVQLQDSSGDVLATTVTDRNGHYTFTQQSGPSANPEIASGVSATGDYNVVLLLSNSLQQVAPNPATIHISRGGLNIRGVNFTVAFDSDSSSSGSGSTSPAAASMLTVASLSGAAVTGSSSGGAASTDATLATALARSTGSGTAATPHSGKASGGGSSSSVSNPNTVVVVAKSGKLFRLLSAAISDAQDSSGQ